MMDPLGPASKTGEAMWLVKWGGGLITDKDCRERLREDVLERLSAELVRGYVTCPAALVLGHGSGSFGHWAARSGPPPDAAGCYRPATAAAIADAAARLHRRVVGALLDAGGRPFSWRPSACLAEELEDDAGAAVPNLLATLAGGYLPVTHGDVVLDSGGRARIWSTERVFEVLVGGLVRRGVGVSRVLWLGNTDGIRDLDGGRIDEAAAEDDERILEATGGSAGVDVTGGMRLRYRTCRNLAARGVESWILDGREPGVLEAALRGERVRGTLVPATP